MVPDVPEEVEMKIKREYYMAKEALAENQVPGRGLTPASSVKHQLDVNMHMRCHVIISSSSSCLSMKTSLEL